MSALKASMTNGGNFRVHPGAATFDEFFHVHEEIRDRATHDQLQNNLVDISGYWQESFQETTCFILSYFHMFPSKL
jgi:hypothetical protein